MRWDPSLGNVPNLEMSYEPVAPSLWKEKSVRELGFWSCWLALHAEEYTQPTPLLPHLKELVNGSGIIADLGAGACCLVGETEGVETRSSDLFGHEYSKMWEALGRTPANPVTVEDMASLTYDDDSFDVVYCANSLDHSADPRAAAQEMASVCKPGGMVFLVHLRDVARGAHYGGLHQWNISRVRAVDDVRIWGRVKDGGEWSESRVNGFWLSECLPGMSSSRMPFLGGRQRVVVRWVKP